jgi:hypothetical protein
MALAGDKVVAVGRRLRFGSPSAWRARSVCLDVRLLKLGPLSMRLSNVGERRRRRLSTLAQGISDADKLDLGDGGR